MEETGLTWGAFLVFVVIIIVIVVALRSSRSAKAKPESEQKTTVIKLDAPTMTKEKEVIREREIVKVRCSYCQQLYNESDGRCPNCGGR